MKSFLDWQPVISAEEVFKASLGFQYLSTDEEGHLFWIENRPHEKGRSVLVSKASQEPPKDLSPHDFSVRSRVFEYGSCPYTVFKGTVYFTDFKNQRIYQQDLKNPATLRPLTPERNKDGTLGKHADMEVSPDGRWLVCAYEKESADESEDLNFIALLDLKNQELQEPRLLVEGASFYVKPTFSPDGSKLAWLEWNHPYMKWDSTKLFIADFKDGLVSNAVHVAGGGETSAEESSISDFTFGDQGELFYALDFAGQNDTCPKNYYNVFVYQDGDHRPVTQELFDFYSLECRGDLLLGLVIEKGQAKILLLDLKTGLKKQLAGEYADVASPSMDRSGNVFAIATSDVRAAEIIQIKYSGETQVLKKSSDFVLKAEDISIGKMVSFPTSDGQTSYGYFYPPVNSHETAPKGEKPPVRVKVHGGPTGMAVKGFNLDKVFWTSQGFAVFDVNYRGSIGFGRRYRDALNNKWGLLEIQDVKDGLEFLKAQELISDQAVIAGGSAGGYSVQRILTFYPDLMSAGASRYGIGNLVTLQRLTHKYEAHYLERLIGGTLENNLKEYEERSPINHLKNLKAPMIILQGSEDKVVPPENSREMAQVLREKGIEHEYHEYPGEAHGFRQKENLVDALQKESDFFKKILKRGS